MMISDKTLVVYSEIILMYIIIYITGIYHLTCQEKSTQCSKLIAI